MRHPERLKDFSLAEVVNRLARNFGEEFSQHDESNVAVLSAAARLGFKWNFNGGVERLFAIVRSLKEFGVSGQARGVCQQHCNSHAALASVSRCELRQESHDPGLQI